MNIREHVLKAIYGGMNAKITQQGGDSGVIFQDENEFMPFHDLNYNSEYGYYRMSQFPNLERDCTNENPETLHRGTDFDGEWSPIVWADNGGNLTLIGDANQAADLYRALEAYVMRGELDAEPISENDPCWSYMRQIPWAVNEYRDYVPGAATQSDAQIADTIRAAARRGAIYRATKGESGNWYFNPPAFRGWLVKTRDENRGRPRADASESTHFDGMVYQSDSNDPAKRVSDFIENFDGNTSGLQHQLAAMAREATGKIPRGQLWQPCEYPGCDNEPVCLNCMMCEDKHCNCDFN